MTVKITVGLLIGYYRLRRHMHNMDLAEDAGNNLSKTRFLVVSVENPKTISLMMKAKLEGIF